MTVAFVTYKKNIGEENEEYQRERIEDGYEKLKKKKNCKRKDEEG